MPPFAPGQIWQYNTRPTEQASRIIICRVESDPNAGQIVHIHVTGIRLKNKHAPGGASDQVSHMPYSAEALQKCLTHLESTTTKLPDFEDGYHEWRTAFDQHQAGIWTAPIAQAIAGIESALNQ